MNSNRMKFKSLGVFLALALCISLVAVALPATPVYADDATDIDITAPTSAALAYVQQGGSVSVTYELTGVGGANTVQIWIYNASGNVGYFSATRASGAPATHTDAVFLDPVVSEGTYSVKATANAIMDTVNGANSVIVDNTGPTVNLSYPNGGECLKGNTAGVYEICWNDNDTYSSDNVTWTLEYRTVNGAAFGNCNPTNSGNTATGYHHIAWTTPAATDSEQCAVQVAVTDRAGNTTTDQSANFFIIDTSLPVVVVSDPDGTASYNAGDPITVEWTAQDPGLTGTLDYVLTYSTDGGATYPGAITTLTNQAQCGGTACTYNWTDTNLHTTQCKVKVAATDCADNEGSGVSATFTIDDTTAPTCEVTSPNGSESWAQGSTKIIAWTAEDLASGNNMTYDLYYCTDYTGTTWKHITTLNGGQPQGNRTYSWTVDNIPTVLTSESTTCRVKVKATDVGGNYVEDISDANFTITVDNTAPTVTLTDPTGTWKAGTCQTISWNASDNTATDTLTVLLTYGGAATPITTLRGVAQGSGSYTWAIPTAAVGSTVINIQVTDESGNNSTIVTSTAVTVSAADAGYLEAPDIVLAADWNLISLPLIPPCTGIESVLGDIIPNVLSVWGYSGGSSGTWSSYAPGAPSSLTDIEDGKAYWINMNVGDTLNVKGVKCYTGPGSTPTQYSYVAGWEMVGFKRTAATTVDTYLGGTGYTTPIYEYNTGTDTYDSKAGGANMTPGFGYWVYFTSATTVSPGCD